MKVFYINSGLEGARILAGALGYRPRKNIFPMAPPPLGAKIKMRAPLSVPLRVLLKIKTAKIHFTMKFLF